MRGAAREARLRRVREVQRPVKPQHLHPRNRLRVHVLRTDRKRTEGSELLLPAALRVREVAVQDKGEI